MPLYDYECEKCHNKITLLRTQEDRDKAITCPQCHKKGLKREVTATPSCTTEEKCSYGC